MKWIYVLVEGQTEREFVARVLAPYFGQSSISISAIPMRKGGGGMGFSNMDHFKNNVGPLLYDTDAPLITTLVDLYRFPVQSSNKADQEALQQWSIEQNVDKRLAGLESLLAAAVASIKPCPNFVPYIQKHEFEALLFSDASAFEYEGEAIVKIIREVIRTTPNPEDINTTEAGHPAKRLETAFASCGKKYSKGADAVDFAEIIGIETMLHKCPRFRAWIKTLLTKAME